MASSRIIKKEKVDVEKEEKWLLSEVKYLNEFKNDIQEILQLKVKIDALTKIHGNNKTKKIELLNELIKKDLKKLPKIERRAGKSERRRIRYEKRILGNIGSLQKQLGQIERKEFADIINKIHIYSGRILKEVSLRAGKISELTQERTPNVSLIKKHTDATLEASKALIVLLEQFKKLIHGLIDYHTDENIARIITVYNPVLRQKILNGQAPLFYYHGTKPQFVKPILKSGILAPEMRLKIRDNEEFNIELMKEVRLFMRMRRTPRMDRLRKDYLAIPGLLHEDKFNPITTSGYSSSNPIKLQSKMFPSSLVITQKAFYPYFDDKLSNFFLKKYEMFYVERLQPEELENISRKINKLVEKRIQVIEELGKEKQIAEDTVDEYIDIIRKAYSVLPHFEYIHGHVNLGEEKRAGASSDIRWVVRKDKWFLYFAADPPYDLYIRFSNMVSWFLTQMKRTCVFEFKPTLYNKIAWKFMGDNLYTGQLQYDICSTEIISLKQYCSRIYCISEDVDYFKKLVKRWGLSINVHSHGEQKKIYAETFAALKG